VNTGESRQVAMDLRFGPDGIVRMGIDPGGVRRTMIDCMNQIPAPQNIRGPANQQWRCIDYCQ
jgi:hypothetical protein